MKSLSSLLFGLLSILFSITFSNSVLAQARPHSEKTPPQSFLAQITTDGTTSTTVTPTDTGVQIDNGDRAEGNLFHSFDRFSIPTGTEAYFNNANDIVNIFSRVTGGNISNIDGLLRANGSANLFLINPAGIVFGEGARLQLGGSFYGSTADSIVFNDGEFSANLDNPPLITVNAPIGLNFRDEPGTITVRGDGLGKRFSADLIDTENALRVNDTATLGLLGGSLNLEGATLKTPGGRIELGSVGDNQTVSLNATDKGFSFDYETVTNFNDINLLQVSNIDASGLINGDIKLQGNNINVIEGSVIEASTFGISSPETPGAIELNATNTITVDGETFTDGSLGFIISQIYFGAVGDTGDIIIDTGSLNISNGAQITAAVVGEGNTGDIIINATDSVILDGLNIDFFISGIFNDVFSSEEGGNSGNIIITADSIFITNGGQVAASTFGEGDAGSISLTATNEINIDGGDAPVDDIGIFSKVETAGRGEAGDISIATGSLNLSNGGQVNASTFNLGNGGNITIDARDTIRADGRNENSNSLSGIYSQVGNFSFTTIGGNRVVRRGGNITINAGSLEFFNGARIDVSVTDLSLGESGNIVINASENIIFQGDNSSNIDINNTNNELSVSGVFSSIGLDATGNAGDIVITASSVSLLEGAQIRASNDGLALEKPFGSDNNLIDIKATKIIVADGNNAVNIASLNEETIGEPYQVSNSGIISVVGSRASGGISELQARDIFIETNSLEITNGAQINSSTLGEGNAGAIAINANDSIILDGEDINGNPSNISSEVDSIAEGDGGNIVIDTGFLGVSDGARVSSSTAGIGDTGSINITAAENMTLDGNGNNATGVFSTVREDAVGNTRGITIETDSLAVNNQSQIDISTFGDISTSSETNRGILDIKANSIALNNSASINAATFSETGGIINLQIAEDLTLRDNSLISARAFNEANGGNLKIDTRFIVAFLGNNANNDIIASAERGQGGEIEINARSLFGIQQRPQSPLTNDISASSDLGLDGTIAIETTDNNSLRETLELSGNVLSAEAIAASGNCSVSDIERVSKLTVRGKGGIMPEPADDFTGDALITEETLTPPNRTQANNNNVEKFSESTLEYESANNLDLKANEVSSNVRPVAYKNNGEPVYLARGIIKQEDGSIILTPYLTRDSRTRILNNSYRCN